MLALVIFYVFANPLFSVSLMPFSMFGGSMGGLLTHFLEGGVLLFNLPSFSKPSAQKLIIDFA